MMNGVYMQIAYPPVPWCCAHIGRGMLDFVSPTNVIWDHYKHKVGLSEEHFHYQCSNRLEHPCNSKRFQQCERYTNKDN